MSATKKSEPLNWHASWSLIAPYWKSTDKWIARLLLASVVSLALGMVYLNVLFNDWNRDFYNALENKNFDLILYIVVAISSFSYVKLTKNFRSYPRDIIKKIGRF